MPSFSAATAPVSLRRTRALQLAVFTACSWRPLHVAAIVRAPRWRNADFFNTFSEAESTYDADLDYGRTGSSPPDGWEPRISNPYSGSRVKKEFFHESPSGGPEIAWQTHPSVNGGVPWRLGTGGAWNQKYTSSEEYTHATRTSNWFDVTKGTKRLPAGWFDVSVDQLDGYGRPKYPSLASPRHYIGWQERSVNTTLRCQEPGCTARVALQAFDGTNERARNCKLTVYVKPTDYDEQWSGENVEFISVNDANVSLNCEPQLSGCNSTAAKPYYPCVQELNLDKLMHPSGTLQIVAKIPQVVDECPYEGNLLYAVPIVTCLVGDQAPPPYYSSNVLPKPNLTWDENGYFNRTSMELRANLPLECSERGCTASTLMMLNSTMMTFSRCTLTIKINATDFDNEEWGGQPRELVEFVKVEGDTVVTNFNARLNPCKQRYLGRPVPPETVEVTLVDGLDVTASASDGILLVEAKISDYVDECAMNGHLFAGSAEVFCNVASYES